MLGYTMLLGPFQAPVGTWLYHRTITINHTLCGGANSTSFPVLVSLSDVSMKTVTNGGHVANSNGYDIMFYADSGFTTLLNWEIEYYNGVTGVLIAWIMIPLISGTTNTTFYMRYDNPFTTSFNGGSLGAAWNNNYQTVYHLAQGTGVNVLDSTSNNRTGTQHGSPTAITGQIDGALSFVTANSQYIDTGTATYLNGLGQATFSAWAKRSATGKLVPIIMRFTSTGQQFELYPDGNCYVGIYQDFAYVSNNNTNWNHYVFTYNGSNPTTSRTNLYINGVLQTLTRNNIPPTTIVTSLTVNLYIGYDPEDAPNYASGNIDEVRILNTALTQSWITTEYNNQSNPGNIGSAGFLTYSNEY